MRTAFIDTLTELAKDKEDIVLLTGDLGFSVLEKYKNRYPDRFFNMGVAEANMAGAAAGLALNGMKPYLYSIIPFITMRCYEQIRNDICYQDVNVKLVGIGSGLGYGYLGPTHHSREDIAIMRALPNMTVVCPGDPIEAKILIEKSVKYDKPMYIRLGKSKEPVIHKENINFEIGQGIQIMDGKDITIIASGNILYNALLSSKELKDDGYSIRLISMPTIKPIDKEIIKKAIKETKAIFSIEEHSIIGGLGDSVAEVLLEEQNKCLFHKIGLLDRFENVVGSHEYLREKNGLNPEQITKNITKTLKKAVFSKSLD